MVRASGGLPVALKEYWKIHQSYAGIKLIEPKCFVRHNVDCDWAALTCHVDMGARGRAVGALSKVGR